MSTTKKAGRDAEIMITICDGQFSVRTYYKAIGCCVIVLLFGIY